MPEEQRGFGTFCRFLTQIAPAYRRVQSGDVHANDSRFDFRVGSVLPLWSCSIAAGASSK